MPTLYSMVNEIGNRNRILEMRKFRFWLVHWIDPRSIEHNYACCYFYWFVALVIHQFVSDIATCWMLLNAHPPFPQRDWQKNDLLCQRQHKFLKTHIKLQQNTCKNRSTKIQNKTKSGSAVTVQHYNAVCLANTHTTVDMTINMSVVITQCLRCNLAREILLHCVRVFVAGCVWCLPAVGNTVFDLCTSAYQVVEERFVYLMYCGFCWHRFMCMMAKPTWSLTTVVLVFSVSSVLFYPWFYTSVLLFVSYCFILFLFTYLLSHYPSFYGTE